MHKNINKPKFNIIKFENFVELLNHECEVLTFPNELNLKNVASHVFCDDSIVYEPVNYETITQYLNYTDVKNFATNVNDIEPIYDELACRYREVYFNGKHMYAEKDYVAIVWYDSRTILRDLKDVSIMSPKELLNLAIDLKLNSPIDPTIARNDRKRAKRNLYKRSRYRYYARFRHVRFNPVTTLLEIEAQCNDAADYLIDHQVNTSFNVNKLRPSHQRRYKAEYAIDEPSRKISTTQSWKKLKKRHQYDK